MLPVNHDPTNATDTNFPIVCVGGSAAGLDAYIRLLQNLPADWNGKLMAVFVSGYDGDGAAALSGIKEAGGTTIAQQLSTARQPHMPESAIDTGCIDLILSPEEIGHEIVRIAKLEIERLAPACFP